MKIIILDQAVDSLGEIIKFSIEQEIPRNKVENLMTMLLDRSESLSNNPSKGQREEYLEHLGLQHRRIVEGHFKIIYRIQKEIIYVTDFFDSRQDPEKMKG